MFLILFLVYVCMIPIAGVFFGRAILVNQDMRWARQTTTNNLLKSTGAGLAFGALWPFAGIFYLMFLAMRRLEPSRVDN